MGYMLMEEKRCTMPKARVVSHRQTLQQYRARTSYAVRHALFSTPMTWRARWLRLVLGRGGLKLDIELRSQIYKRTPYYLVGGEVVVNDKERP